MSLEHPTTWINALQIMIKLSVKTFPRLEQPSPLNPAMPPTQGCKERSDRREGIETFLCLNEVIESMQILNTLCGQAF
jgi:hypothetical protein